MGPIRVLQVLASLDRGGAETMIMNLYRSIDKNKVQFDFAVNASAVEYAYEAEVRKLGGRIFYLPRYTITNHRAYKCAWTKLLLEHREWKIVHGHHTSTAFIYLGVAKELMRLTIAHSHTSGFQGKVKSLAKIVMRYPLRYLADFHFACSQGAVQSMFGCKAKHAYILRNAINVKDYTYNPPCRQKMRDELNVSDKFVVAHIGNFTAAKNYPFILRIFKELHRVLGNAKLLLIGKDSNYPSIRQKIREMGIEEAVIITGVRSDIPSVLQAVDVFFFPSIMEGLPVSLIEAQAAGLPCITSDVITAEAKITGLVETLSLKQPYNQWIDCFLKYAHGYERRDMSQQIRDAGYDVEENARWLEAFYESAHMGSSI